MGMLSFKRPSEEDERQTDHFQACMRSILEDEERVRALAAIWKSGVLPGIIFRDEELLQTYIAPLLSLNVQEMDILQHVIDLARKNKHQKLETVLTQANVVVKQQTSTPANTGFRIVGSIRDYVVIHWIGLPDAFDQFVPKDLFPIAGVHESMESLASANLSVSSDFNDLKAKHAPMWINPLDFVTMQPNASAPNSPQQPPAKKVKVDPSVLERLQGVAADAVKTVLDQTATKTSNPILYGHLAPSPAPTLKNSMTVDQQTVVVPSCSRWFSLNSIHPIEKRMLPEFFQDNKAKTPQVYLTYRNYMVNSSRAAPHVYLTATACRRNLAGDACSILRVHEFLTHWGLINYHVPAHAAPPSIPTLDTFEIPSTTTKSTVEIDDQFSCQSCGHGQVEYELTPEAKRKERLVQHGTPLRKLDAWGVRPGTGVCNKCFSKHNFPSHFEPSDFSSTTQLLNASEWTDEDKRQLLAALKDLDTSQPIDWNEIAHSVGKSAKECVTQFLRTPLDPALKDSSESPHITPQVKPRTAFPYSNSVLNVAEIVASADPTLSKAASEAAIACLERLNQPKQPATENKKASDTGVNAIAKSAMDAGMSIKKEGSIESHEAAAKTQTTAATAAAVLAARAKGIAKHEEGVVKNLLEELLQRKMESIQLKLKSLNHLEGALQAERDQIAKERYELYLAKLNHTAQNKATIQE